MVAQLVEQLPLKQLVPGSSPGQPTKENARSVDRAFSFIRMDLFGEYSAAAVRMLPIG